MQLDSSLETSPDSSKEVSVEPPRLKAYSDYRVYLKDFYKFKRQTESFVRRPYSYSHFSAAADIKSPNYLKLIIEGKRNLSDRMVDKFARALKLQKSEVEEFRALVRYNQATDPLERNQHLRELSEIRGKRQQLNGATSQGRETAPSWLNWVLYAMADQLGVDFEPERLQKLLRRHVTIDQIREALEALKLSGQMAREIDGEWKKNRSVPDQKDPIPVEVIRKLQSELIYLGLESFFKDEPVDREFGAFTLALTEEEFKKVRFELRRVRKALQKEIMMNREKSKGERVYQLNVQLFPLTDSVPLKS